MVDNITLTDGRTFRVELNWNAISAFLASSGRDDVSQLATFSELHSSDLAGLLAAGINEGERLEGRETRFTAEDVGALSDLSVISAFIGIFSRQMTPKGADEAKKD